jgi:hypothetical protein
MPSAPSRPLRAVNALGAAVRLARTRSPAFRALYARAMRDVVESCEAAGATFWFTEGTLIWMLRYGRNDPSGIRDVVDDDVDLMIETATHEEWLARSEELWARLRERGWRHRTRSSTSRARGARPDKMQVWLRGPRLHRLNADVHSYLRDEAAGVAISHGDAHSYPFQRWGGRLPLGLVHPLAAALCYGRPVPCPNRPLELLEGWNGGEYAGHCVAVPLFPLTRAAARELRDSAAALAGRGFRSMREHLEGCPEARAALSRSGALD